MARSPYYVDPGYDYTKGLRGLQAGLEFREKKRLVEKISATKKAEKEEAIRKKKEAGVKAIAAYKTNDPDKIAAAILEEPEIGEVLGELYDKRREYDKEVYGNDLEKLMTELETTGNIKPPEPSVYDPKGGLSGMIGGTYPGAYDPSKSGQKPITKTDIIRSVFAKDPKKGKQMIEYEFAKNDPKKYKAWKDVYRPGEKEVAPTDLKKSIDERQALLDEGVSKDDPRIKAYDKKLWPDESDKDITPSNVMKMYGEREKLLAEGMDPKSDIIRGLDRRILGEAAPKGYSPSGLMKLIRERQDFLDTGEDPDGDIIQAYDNRIAGIDINVKEITPEQYKFLGIYAYITGKMPSVGRGKMATKVRMGILKAKADYGLKVAREELAAAGIVAPEDELPGVAAFNAITTQTETGAIKGAWGWLEKQEASMGSYVDNIGKQLDELKNLSKDLYSFDARLLNVPLRFVRGRIMGSPLQNKYDLFLKEISRETTKLALGATQSIAPPSVEEIKTWDRIHDPALSIPDAIEVLEMSKNAAHIRYKSVTDQLNRVRERMKTRDYTSTLFKEDKIDPPKVRSKNEGGQADFNALPSGTVYRGSDGKLYKKP